LEKSTFEEIGCIHTAQGRDFNYAGIIFGTEIDYDEINDNITVNFKEYPSNPLSGLSLEEKINIIKNAYYVLLTRGIMGHGVYIPNIKLRNRFNKMISERIKFTT